MATYRVPVLEDFSWQPLVLDKDLFDAPAVPSKGDRYIVASGTTSGDDWYGHTNDITYYDGSIWQFDTPEEGWFVYVKDEHKVYRFNDSSEWDIEDVSELEADVISIDTRATNIESSVGSIDTNLENTDSSVGSIDTHVDSCDSSIVSINTRATNIESSVGSINTAKQDKGTSVSEYGAIEFSC